MSEASIPLRLCDDDGMVSDALIPPEENTLDTTWRERLNRLRAESRLRPYEGDPFPCTGSAHLAGFTMLCVTPIHDRDGAALTAPSPEAQQ